MIVCPWRTCSGCLDLDKSPLSTAHAYDLAIIRAGPPPARWRLLARWLRRRRVTRLFEQHMGWR